MSSLARKVKRNKDKKERKLVEKALAQKLNMFDRLGEQCMTCEQGFDKKNKEQAMSWQVIVNEQHVSLYCPKCWASAVAIVEKHRR